MDHPKGRRKRGVGRQLYGPARAARAEDVSHKKISRQLRCGSHIEVRESTHVADSASVTVKEAGELWLESAERPRLERTTLDQYRQHLWLHIEPFLGHTMLSRLTAPTVRAFEDRLRKGRDEEASTHPDQLRGSQSWFVARRCSRARDDRAQPGARITGAPGKNRHADRHNGKLKIGVDIPTPAEVKRIVEAAKGHWRPFLLRRSFPGYAHRNCVVCGGQTWTLRRANCTFASGPTASTDRTTEESGRRTHRSPPPDAYEHVARVETEMPEERRQAMALAFPMARAMSNGIPIWSCAACSRRWSGRLSSMPKVRPNIPVCTPYGTSMRHGARALA